MHSVETIPNDRLDPLFDAVVQATEKAVVNALVDQNVDAASSRVWQTEKRLAIAVASTLGATITVSRRYRTRKQ